MGQHYNLSQTLCNILKISTNLIMRKIAYSQIEHISWNPVLCQEKCRDNPDCDAWTFNTRNGWCALKTEEQVKETQTEGFVSGFKICRSK